MASNEYSGDSEDTFCFSNGEGNSRVERKIKRHQITAERIAMMFEVELEGLIVEEFGSLAIWPNRDGRFDLSAFLRGSCLLVEGKKSVGRSTQPASLGHNSSSNFSQLFRSVVPGKSAKKKMATYSLKVTRAEKEGLKVINASRQTYISVNESTANVPFITTQCRDDFGEDTLQLVTANGLAVEDSESTRGLAFWKAASRKLFAVSVKGVKKRIISIDDDNDDVSLSASLMSAPTHSGISQDVNMQDIKDTVVAAVADGLKKELPESLKLIEEKLNSNFYIVQAVQSSLLRDFLACFECLLCKETIKPPVIVSTCCESVIACDECITKLFQSGTSTCPKCRSEDFIAIHLKGFDIITRLNQTFTRVD